MQWQQEVSLKTLNTFGFESVAQRFVELKSNDDVIAVAQEVEECPQPLLILGGGSNLILAPRIPGVVAKMAMTGREVDQVSDDEVLVTFGAGENWHQVVAWLLENGFFGAENLALIPGVVGSAPVQNIGAYGVEIKDLLESVEAYDREYGEFVRLDKAECEFDYRDSRFKRVPERYIITRVQLRLSRVPTLKLDYAGLRSAVSETPTPQEVFDAVCRIRREKLPDPAVLGNAGSFFKNPVIDEQRFEALKLQFPDLVSYPDKDGVKLAAGWLIDRAGFKGVRRDGVGIHDRQALVLINTGTGTMGELARLAGEVQRAIKQMFGITLEPEPRFYP